jgi:hypothetical protein
MMQSATPSLTVRLHVLVMMVIAWPAGLMLGFLRPDGSCVQHQASDAT